MLSILESEQHDERSKNILISALNQLRDRILQRLEKDKENGEIALEKNILSIANHMTALITGMTTMARAGFSQKELENLIDDSVVTLLK
jgi:TetR/AcrR family transcriptional repressor of nem operon